MKYNVTIEEIVDRIYPEGESESAIALLKELNFYSHLSACVSIVNTKLNDEEEEIKKLGSIQLSAVASSLLSGTNERLRSLSEKEKVKNIEQVIADISKEIIEFVMQNIKSDKNTVISQIAHALHDTCVIYNYDENVLMEMLGLRTLQHYANVLLKGDKVKPVHDGKLHFYVWKGKPDKKDAFISIFSKYKLIVDNKRKNFHKLFDTHHEPLNIQFDKAKKNLILTLFHQLKNKHKVLKCTGRDGFYAPLKHHVVDFHEEFLEKKPPKTMNDKLIKSKTEWAANTGKIEKWMKEIL